MNVQKTKEDLLKLIQKSGEIVRKGYAEKDKGERSKEGLGDILTKFDLEVDSLIVNHLRKNYPDCSIMSEESPLIEKASEYIFLIDPIDGTSNFVKGVPLFHTGIALAEHNKVVLSLTYNPITNELFHAVKNEGAFLNNKRVKVSDEGIEKATINLRTWPDMHLEEKLKARFGEVTHNIGNQKCSHDEISGISSGKYGAFVSSGSSPWDYCHYLLVTEAGGKVTDWKGEEFDVTKNNILLSNGNLHSQLLSVLD